MAGQPIIRAYRIRLAEQGGPKAALNRIAAGETLGRIAASMGISRAFLSFHLLRGLPGGKAAVWVARCKAAEMEARAEFEQASKSGRPSDALDWIAANGGMQPPTFASDSFRSSETERTEIGRLYVEALRKVNRESQQQAGGPPFPR